MNPLTIRGFDDDLRRAIEALARERGISLNKAAVLLIRRGAGLDDDGADPKVIRPASRGSRRSAVESTSR